MKVAIIGAGNMGGAIALGMAKGTIVNAKNIVVADPSKANIDRLIQQVPEMNTTANNAEAVKDADIVILAVKPWLVEIVLKDLPLKEQQILVSIAAGVSTEKLAGYTNNGMTIFRLIPNTAISQMASMTFVTSNNATKEQQQLILDIFNEMGLAMPIQEKDMGAATALASCGIAYALKYIHAGMQAGIEMGIYPKDAMTMVAQSMKGAAELILNNDTHPATEIDKVCTPGGITIKGINELEHNGFSSAIIKAMKASNK
ncbi:MAG: pyrroline-5-carboxylate reductase [Mediterranea massiliensis]|nr:pyrroline-5-carboxylate reductase [Mediterranea massiliensis]